MTGDRLLMFCDPSAAAEDLGETRLERSRQCIGWCVALPPAILACPIFFPLPLVFLQLS
jgi:hypothetical protein